MSRLTVARPMPLPRVPNRGAAAGQTAEAPGRVPPRGCRGLDPGHTKSRCRLKPEQPGVTAPAE